jgi:hypothetical protein
MSLEHIVDLSKKIEAKLEALGASGRGLHEKATSIERLLGPDLIKQIRFLASVRNKLLHDPEVRLSESLLADYSNTAANVISCLDGILPQQTRPPKEPRSAISDNVDLAAAWRDASVTGKAAVVAGALVVGALWIKWKVNHW